MIDVVVKTEYKFALHAPDCALHLCWWKINFRCC